MCLGKNWIVNACRIYVRPSWGKDRVATTSAYERADGG